jgi:membrane protease YdiL (CAAX protease family)
MIMKKDAQTRETNRSRRLYQRPVLAIVLVLVLYLITEAISEFTARSLFEPSEGALVLVKLCFFSILAFIIIPLLLKLPRGDVSFSEYLEVIGLRTRIPFGRIIILALSCYLIFAASQLSGSLIYYSSRPGEYVLDLSRHSLLGTGSINAGIFEEILFRGVIVTILLGVFPSLRAVLISAVIFGGLHLLNLANPEYATVWVLAQSVWAFGLGLIYACLFVTTRTIWPLILLHYLINSLVGVWLRGPDGQDATSALYGIIFFGLLPAGLAILWGRYLWKRWESANQGPSQDFV